jgi:hypothetical protein
VQPEQVLSILWGSHISKADLSDAYLSGAHLFKADLSGARHSPDEAKIAKHIIESGGVSADFALNVGRGEAFRSHIKVMDRLTS